MLLQTSKGISSIYKPRWPFGINWDSPQAVGLEVWVPFVFPSGAILTKNGSIGTTIGLAPFRANYEGTYGIDFNKTDNNWAEFAYPDAPFISVNGITVIWCGVVDTQTPDFRHFAGKHATNGATANPFDFRNEEGTTTLRLVRSNTAARVWAGPSYSNSVYQVIAFRVADNLIQTAPDFFVNGVKTAGTSGTTDTGAVTGSEANIRIGQRASGSAVQMDGFCSEVRFYNRAISDGAIQELSQPDRRFNLYWSPTNTSYLFVGTAAGGTPFFQTEWPNPKIRKLNTLGLTGNNPSFYPPPEPIQNRQNDWPLPLIARKNFHGWTDNYVFEDENIKPVGSQEFIVRFPARKSNPDWFQARPQFYQDNKPFKQDQWPNPELRKKPAITFIHNRKLDEPPIPEPFRPIDFRNPDLVRRIRQDWSDRFSLVRQDVRPVGKGAIDLPVLRLKPEGLTWINPRPIYYQEPAAIVFKQTDWPNPLGRRGLVGIVNRHFINSPATTFPFRELNWPLPLRKRSGQGWIDNYVIDENLPFVAQITFVPISKSNFTPTWLNFSPNVVEAGTPIVPYDYPNPIIVKQQTKTWIDNLLQSTLDPGEGEKPFNQNDYPNPLIGARNFHSGIINTRRFDSIEPPLQIGQYDWPVFRAVKRNDVGFIDFKIGSSDPLFSTIDFVPVVRVKRGSDWIYSSLVNLTEIVGLKPFSQNDWPIFRRIYNYDLYNFLRLYNNVPPNIIGRLICLDAGLIEYDLEAALEPYDLDGRIQIFDLDAGGIDCE
jgi:hypothetical protein